MALNLLALPLLAWTGALRGYALYWLLPLVTVLQVLLRLRAVLEHGAVGDTRDSLRAARTTLCPGWIRWPIYPHNMNFHVEHHLYPAIPHYRLPEAHRELVKAGVAARSEVVGTLREALRKIFADPVAEA